ncbi:hypothetical protein [Puniceibacterium sp. IMCC21224]|uniref:hypothetical protein n=1 Tax=Puniceibacterium sp. IMCC21224 TaxID=1618204 RepID=UPI00064DDD49|nr:hypothetical protein [Puniceibacterium sp. IMCC21224]
MSRPKLEVADIFRAFTPEACLQHDGAAWRAANAGHISLDQLKVMSAIERCRTLDTLKDTVAKRDFMSHLTEVLL